jgi:hypothetical protein
LRVSALDFDSYQLAARPRMELGAKISRSPLQESHVRDIAWVISMGKLRISLNFLDVILYYYNTRTLFLLLNANFLNQDFFMLLRAGEH